MSDTIDGFLALKAHHRERRARLGVNCPRCKEVRPKAHASILLPGQRCKVDGYIDPRPDDRDEPVCEKCGDTGWRHLTVGTRIPCEDCWNDNGPEDSDE